MAVETETYWEGDKLVIDIHDDGEPGDPADDWLLYDDFPQCLWKAIRKTSECSWNGAEMFPPPDRPWAAELYEQMFCYAISDEEDPDTRSPVHLLNVAEAVRTCACLPKPIQENLLFNIRLRL